MRNAIMLLAVSLAVGIIGCAEQATKDGAGGAGRFILRVNAGADKEYVDLSGAAWLADQEYSAGAKWGALGGKTVSREGLEIKGTPNPDVYLTERYSMEGYRFDLPNGNYTVRLHFAETFPGVTDVGMRVFTVNIQGKPVLTDFDVFKEAGGFAKPVVKTFKDVAVADGNLRIEFERIKQSPEINGIEVLAP